MAKRIVQIPLDGKRTVFAEVEADQRVTHPADSKADQVKVMIRDRSVGFRLAHVQLSKGPAVPQPVTIVRKGGDRDA